MDQSALWLGDSGDEEFACIVGVRRGHGDAIDRRDHVHTVGHQYPDVVARADAQRVQTTTDAHGVLARTLERLPATVDALVGRDARIESFAPASDIAAMAQQYLHSRLFRS